MKFPLSIMNLVLSQVMTSHSKYIYCQSSILWQCFHFPIELVVGQIFPLKYKNKIKSTNYRLRYDGRKSLILRTISSQKRNIRMINIRYNSFLLYSCLLFTACRLLDKGFLSAIFYSKSPNLSRVFWFYDLR